ncbi:MAG: 16S rRNA (uracil(1498)-N(3))-methyltransferase [Cytophagales bacterium]|nr:16S rRNA (uracil(1498)-N(3))-methyltransferase [Cytophagales bacterium]
MILFYQPDLENQNACFLSEEESRHCVKVLRKKNGDQIIVVDGKGNRHQAVITNAQPKKCEFEIQSTESFERNPYNIHIAIAPTKNIDRIEWFVEKAVEFGVDEISFIQCARSERKNLKPERLIKKAVSAAKQSLKFWFPKINALTSYNDFIQSASDCDQRFIAYVDETLPEHLKSAARPNKKICVMIGPEGDFSPEEIKTAFNNSFQAIHLGKSRLRTETAGIAAAHILNLINE